MAQQNNNESIWGFACVFIGLALFILSVGPLLIKLIQIIGAIWILNYGLYLQNQPPVWKILSKWLTNFRG